MHYLENLSVRQRLMAILSVWILIFIGFGSFAIFEMRELGKVVRNIYEHPLQVSNAAIEARVDILKIQRDMKDIILARDKAEITSRAEKLKPLEERVLHNLDIIRDYALSLQSKQLEKDAREVLLQWAENRQRIIDLMLQGDVSQATRISKEKNSVYVDSLESMLLTIDANAGKRAQEFLKEAKTIEDSQRTILITIIASASFAFLIFFILVTSSILKPIQTLKSAMDKSTNTGHLSLVRLKGKNEIADMSNYYNILVNKLKDVFWIKDTQNQLGHQLSGYMTIEALAQNTVNFLARALSAGKGLFYLYDKNTDTLVLKAAFAFTEEDKRHERLAMGERIVGQAAFERKPIFLKSIRKQDEIIGSGIISEAPLSIYALPLINEDELYGVVELASFEAFDEIKLQLLNESSSIISSSLCSVIQTERIRNLLQVSEKAQEEVRKSAEELQNANAVLQQQQELLQQQTEELQQTNLQLEEQQQQLEEQTNTLNWKNRKLEESGKELALSNKYKSEFLANMSHELRTPLNSIILLSKLLLNKAKDRLNESDKEKVDVINQSGQELLRLINDILDLSKIESGRMSLEAFDFHSASLVEEISQMFRGIANEKKLSLVTEDALNSTLHGDRYKISQILRNLVSNAIKFTAKGSVTLKIMPDTETPDGIVCLVKDTGVGISDDKLSSIFEEFQQGDGSVSRKFGGTGLGLSISKKLSDLMDGEIHVKSTAGEGSEFYLFLPNLISSHGTPDLSQPLSGSEKRKYGGIETKYEIPADSTDKLILVIEDDKSFAKYIENTIHGMGFKPLVAVNGKEGLRLAEDYRPHGILLDLSLPDINGIDVLRELKSTVELRDIPVHILSIQEKSTKPQKLGAVGFRQKPVEENDITRLISQMFAFSEKNPKQLLLIEDNPVQQEAIKELIGSNGIVIKAVDTEEAAMREIVEGNYDAVILDLELKEGSGINVCQYVGEQKLEIPVIVYTGRDLTTEQEKEIRKYADSIIIKTANSEERLLDEVTLFLHKVRKNKKDQYYLNSKTKEEYALNLESKTILVVDDDPRNVFVLASALEDYGATIIEAGNGKAALQKLSRNKVDLILMDIMMPEMDGYETIRSIRKSKALKNIPIIALTAKSLKGDREKCIAAGADDYIAKPVDYDVLIRLVKAWTAKL